MHLRLFHLLHNITRSLTNMALFLVINIPSPKFWLQLWLILHPNCLVPKSMQAFKASIQHITMLFGENINLSHISAMITRKISQLQPIGARQMQNSSSTVVGEVGQQSKIVYSQYGDLLLQSDLHSQHNTTYKVDRKQVVREGGARKLTS